MVFPDSGRAVGGLANKINEGEDSRYVQPPEAMRGSVALLQRRVRLMSMAHVVFKALWMSVVCAAIRGCGGDRGHCCSKDRVDLHGDCAGVCGTMGDHVDVGGPCCCQKSCGSPCSVHLPTVKGKEATFAETVMTTDSRLRKRDTEGFCGHPHPHPTPAPQ